MADAFSSKKRHYLPSIPFIGGDAIQSSNKVVVASSLFVFAFVLWLRSWQTISVPSLFVEDAFHYFNNYYGGQLSIKTILTKPNGYYNILNNFVAWAVAFADVRIQPALYVVFAMFVSFCAVFLVSFSGIIRDRLLLFSMPFVLGLTGLNHIFYYVTLTFQMYVLIIVLLMIILLPAPKSWGTIILQCMLSAILVFSGPYSVVSIPVCLILCVFFNDKKKRFLWGFIILSAMFYLSVSGGSARIDNVFQIAILEKMFQVMIRDVFFLGLVEASILKLSVIVLLFVSVFFYMLRKKRLFLYLAISLLAVSVISLIPFFLSSKIEVYKNPYPCHLVISQFFWIVFVMYLIDTFIIEKKISYLFKCSMMVVLFSIVIYDNTINKQKSNVKTNVNIRSFTNKIKHAESLNLKDSNKYVIILSPGARQRAFMPKVRVGSTLDSATEATISDNPLHID